MYFDKKNVVMLCKIYQSEKIEAKVDNDDSNNSTYMLNIGNDVSMESNGPES